MSFQVKSFAQTRKKKRNKFPRKKHEVFKHFTVFMGSLTASAQLTSSREHIACMIALLNQMRTHCQSKRSKQQILNYVLPFH